MATTDLRITIDSRMYTFIESAAKYIGCSKNDLEKEISKAFEEGSSNFIINDISVKVEYKKLEKIYVKYIFKDSLTIYLVYLYKLNGKKELIRTLDSKSFSKLEIPESEIIIYDGIEHCYI